MDMKKSILSILANLILLCYGVKKKFCTYHNPENVLMDNIPIRSVRSCFEHDTSKLVIKVEPNKSESLTSRQIKPIEEKVNIEENKEENTSLNESDFDNYESVSSEDNESCSQNLKLQRESIEEQLKKQICK